MYIGWLAALVTGLAMPSTSFLMGELINSFDPSNGATDMLDMVSKVAMI
jgi:hypothetical protein